MKIAHISDLHITAFNRYSIDGSRLSDLNKKLNKLFNEFVHLGIDIVFITGDVFDNYNPSNNLINVFVENVRILIENNIKVRVIVGNHDTDGIRTAYDSINNIYFGSLDLFRILYKPEIEKIANVGIAYLPWMKSMNEEIIDIQAKINKLNISRKILVTHGSVKGAKYDNGKKSEDGILKKLLRGWDYVALGDFHNFQNVIGNAYYSGSIQKITWNERDNKKGWILYNSYNNDVTFTEIKDNDFIQLNLSAASIRKNLNKSIKKIGGKKIKDSFIKLTVKGNVGDGNSVYQFVNMLYSNGCKDVELKMINTSRSNDNKNFDSLGFNLDLKEHLKLYIDDSGIKDKKKYFKYIMDKYESAKIR